MLIKLLMVLWQGYKISVSKVKIYWGVHILQLLNAVLYHLGICSVI